MLKTTPCWCLSDYCTRPDQHYTWPADRNECAGCPGPCVMEGVAARLVTDIERVIGVIKAIDQMPQSSHYKG